MDRVAAVQCEEEMPPDCRPLGSSRVALEDLRWREWNLGVVVVLHEASQFEESGRVWCSQRSSGAVVYHSATLDSGTGVCDAVWQCVRDVCLKIRDGGGMVQLVAGAAREV